MSRGARGIHGDLRRRRQGVCRRARRRDGPASRRTSTARIRSGRATRNNFGDVWVVATYPSRRGGKTLRARAHLLVTVPLYMNWFTRGEPMIALARARAPSVRRRRAGVPLPGAERGDVRARRLPTSAVLRGLRASAHARGVVERLSPTGSTPREVDEPLRASCPTCARWLRAAAAENRSRCCR